VRHAGLPDVSRRKTGRLGIERLQHADDGHAAQRHQVLGAAHAAVQHLEPIAGQRAEQRAAEDRSQDVDAVFGRDGV
jgi:hypothetical protein